MHFAFLNPQGNFDAADSHLTEHPDFGGQLVYVKEVAQSLVDLGHKVDIVTRLIDDPEWPEFSEPVATYPGYDETSLRIVRIPCGGPLFLAKERLWTHMAEFVDGIARFYGDALPEFATGHYADGGYCSVLLKARLGIPFTFTGHSLGAQKLDKLGTTAENWTEMEERFRFSSRIAAERLSMEQASRIITSTAQERDEQYSHPLYQAAIDVSDTQRFSVIPPGVNMTVFNREPNDEEADIAASLADRVRSDGPFVVVSSRLDEKKNIIGVVEAFAKSEMLRRNAELVLCIRGIDDIYGDLSALSEEERAVLEPIVSLIVDAKLRGSVHHLNIQSQRELAATYRFFANRRSIFALTAFYEPFGLAPIEAAACGLACVATKNGGPSEIFADGSGLLVDPFDSTDIADGLLRAVDQQKNLSDQGFERVLSTYTWQKTAENYYAVARSAASGAERSGNAGYPLDSTGRIETYLAGRK